MTATATGTDSRQIPGVGLLEYEEQPYRRYWLTPEGGKRRRRLPSVTTILRESWAKPELVAWAARTGDQIDTVREAAFARGKAVHRFIETYMATGELLPTGEFEPTYRPFIEGAAAFLFEYDPQPEAVEQLVCHPELGYAGRFDLRARVHGHSAILDFKTGSEARVYAEAHVQTFAYALADERCGAPLAEQRLIVGIGEDGSHRVVQGGDATELWNAVLAFDKARRGFMRSLEDGR
ncbi:MAG: hypothetical protein ABWY20_23825 [Mycobacterium sp.]